MCTSRSTACRYAADQFSRMPSSSSSPSASSMCIANLPIGVHESKLSSTGRSSPPGTGSGQRDTKNSRRINPFGLRACRRIDTHGSSAFGDHAAVCSYSLNTNRKQGINMRRITIIAVLAAVALFATAAVAGANVAVADGVGTVGRGDVQNALGYANDAALQSNYTTVKFGGGSVKAERIWAEYFIVCWNSDQIMRRMFYIPGTAQVTVNATPVLNNNHKVTGWTLTGQSTEFTQDGPFDSSNIAMRDEIPEGCIPGADVPAGGPLNTWYPDMNGPVVVKGTSGLTVRGTVNGKTVT